MTGMIPETITRLQTTVFVSDTELSALGRDRIIRVSAEQMAEQTLGKLLRDCIKTEGDYMGGYQGQTLQLDVYVLAPRELHKLIAEARMQGEHDAQKWNLPRV